ncbi:N-lysine methyltransferase KMT5A-A-like [Thalassophryne amazonica]|uniref:N-lysine methyltransferase KMT5A-A-like n=1 Tax=Thalassophryne amazonica TaxID=390379 RepID=UPI0014726860|nr:N-lysine methyltransferase KMT5A-A-like [Thalassophryne amazonica]
MNGEIVHNGCSVSALNCTKSLSLHHNEKTGKVEKEETCSTKCPQQNDVERQEEERRTNTISSTPKDFQTDLVEGNYSRSSPCWPDEHQSPPQPHQTQNCLHTPTEVSFPLSNGVSYSTTPPTPQRRAARVKVKGKKSTRRIAAGGNQNRKITEYYPIRRSSRKSKTELKCEQKKLIDDLITKGIEEGMEVQHIEGKGRAVFATRCFQKGEYVVEYHGDLLQIHDAKKREVEYAENPATGCYMYYFQYLCKTYCVDATKETGRMGRLINHSKNGNCQTKLHDISGIPHLILVASRDIDEGEELLYDYGDRSKASIAAHPWLKN